MGAVDKKKKQMKQLILVILFLSIVTFMKCDDNPVCDCCKDKYGLGCEQWDNGYGWWACAEELEELDHDHGSPQPLVELVQVEEDEHSALLAVVLKSAGF